IHPPDLPSNVELRGPIAHESISGLMRTWHAGLIPFLKNELTQSVDPVKYYEYRACGLPILSTMFGEMLFHAVHDPEVWFFERLDFSKIETFLREWHEKQEFLTEYEKSSFSDYLKHASWPERFETGVANCSWLV
ncbi:MAG: hypothetical protein KIG95_07910, partial [Comamonas sp.]|nr:hypothetical protein [Comamonas sp.]